MEEMALALPKSVLEESFQLLTPKVWISGFWVWTTTENLHRHYENMETYSSSPKCILEPNFQLPTLPPAKVWVSLQHPLPTPPCASLQNPLYTTPCLSLENPPHTLPVPFHRTLHEPRDGSHWLRVPITSNLITGI